MLTASFPRVLAKRFERIVPVLFTALVLTLAFADDARAPCALPDLPSCACFNVCDLAVPTPWPPPLSGDIIEIAHSTVLTQSCCFQHGGQAYWQIQRQATNAACAEALAFLEPTIETDAATDAEAWCTETIAYWGDRATTPYAQGYYTARHHLSSYVTSANEMRQWYIDEEAIGGLIRGRWIDGTELDYANFEPGVNGPCPGAYQQIFKWEPADTDGDGTPWNNSNSHSQMIDSMVVYRLGAIDGPVQRIDVRMVQGNIGFAAPSVYARVTNTTWYYDIMPFTALGPDASVLDTKGRKIRGWGVNMNSDGSVDTDPARIRTVVTLLIRAYPAPTGSENSDAAHVSQMLAYHSATGGGVDVTTNSSLVSTGGALPTETVPWVIPPAPHPADPVYIDVDLRAQHPNPVESITIDWVDAVPSYFEVWWSGVPVTIMKRFVTVPTGAPSVPAGTTIPFTVALSPGTIGTGFPIRYARICIPNTSLTRTFSIRGIHYNYYFTDKEDGGGSSPEGDAIATAVNRGVTPALQLSEGIPNPFSGSTTMSFELPQAGPAELAIYDVGGRLVRTLRSGSLASGLHEERWDGVDDRGSRLPSGVYFARLEWHGTVATRKLVLLR